MIRNFFIKLLSRESGEQGEGNREKAEYIDTETALDKMSQILSDFGLDKEDMKQVCRNFSEIEEKETIQDYIRDCEEIIFQVGDSITRSSAFHEIHNILRWSRIGIYSDWKYFDDQPESQINEVLKDFNYEIRLRTKKGKTLDNLENWDDAFNIMLLENGEVKKKTEFNYSDSDLKSNNYPELIKAVNSVLPENLEFYQLAGVQDSWEFIILEDAMLKELEDKYGKGIELFGETLLFKNTKCA